MLTILFILFALFIACWILRQIRSGHQRDEESLLELERALALRKWPELKQRDRMRKAKEEAYKEMLRIRAAGGDAAEMCERYLRLLDEEQRLMREEFAARALGRGKEQESQRILPKVI